MADKPAQTFQGVRTFEPLCCTMWQIFCISSNPNVDFRPSLKAPTMNLADITLVPEEIRFLYLRMVSHMASVDGELADSELALLTNMIGKFKLPKKKQKSILSSTSLTEEEVKEGFEKLRANQLQYSFLLDLIIMAMADGFLHDAEKVFLAKVNDWVQIPRAEFHNLIYFAQSAASVVDTSNIDPILSYVFENFFRWARQGHVKLFQQTHFAVSDAVDLYLKHEL